MEIENINVLYNTGEQIDKKQFTTKMGKAIDIHRRLKTYLTFY